MEAVEGGGKLAAAMAKLESAKATAAAAEAARKAAALEAIAEAREAEEVALAELKATLLEEEEKARTSARKKAKAARKKAKAARKKAKAARRKAKAKAADLPDEEAADPHEDPDEESPESDDDLLPRSYTVKDEPSLVAALGGPPRPRRIKVGSVPNMAAAAVMHKIAADTNLTIFFPNKFELAYVARYHEILEKDVRLTSIAFLMNNPKSAMYKKMLREQGASVTLMGRSMGGNFGKRANAIGQWMAAYAALEDQPKSSPLLKELREAVMRLMNHPINFEC